MCKEKLNLLNVVLITHPRHENNKMQAILRENIVFPFVAAIWLKHTIMH